MAQSLDKVAQSLFEKIRSRFPNVNIGDEKAQSTSDPEQARFFNFDYVSKDKKNFGNVTISLVDNNALKIYYSKNISDKLDELQKKEWFDFLLSLRMFAKRNMLSFDTRDISRSSLELKDIKTIAKTDSAHTAKDVMAMTNESRSMWGNPRRSYQMIENVRLVINHSRPIDEERRGSRARYIESIFVETANGERFRMPFNNLSAARAAARHIAEGGALHDDIGQHIVRIVKEMNDMRYFVRSMKHRQFEDTQAKNMVEAAVDRYYQLSNQMHKMQGRNGYRQFAETFTAPTDEQLNEVDVNSLKEKFVRKVFDDRLMSALPYVQAAYEARQARLESQFETVKAILEHNLPLVLKQDNVQDSLMRLKSYQSGPDLIAAVLEDVANRAQQEHVAEFARKWSTGYSTLSEQEDEQLQEEQMMAVQLVTKYLRDLGSMQTNPGYVLEVRACRTEGHQPRKSLIKEFEEWVDDITEGTWAIPQQPEDVMQLQELFNSEFQIGVNGENATSALYNLIGDDELFDWLAHVAEQHGPEYDIRADLARWLTQHMPKVAELLDFSHIEQLKQQSPPAQNTPTQNGVPARESIQNLKALAGL